MIRDTVLKTVGGCAARWYVVARTAAFLGAAALLTACGGESGLEDSGQRSSTPEYYTVGEASQLTAECMRERGWDIDYVAGDAGWSFEGSQDDLERFEADSEACGELYPTDPRLFSELSDAEQQALYDESMAQADCIRDLGHPVPENPTFELWASAARGESEYPEPINSVPRGARADVLAQCPYG